jgi:hypothetical protein
MKRNDEGKKLLLHTPNRFLFHIVSHERYSKRSTIWHVEKTNSLSSLRLFFSYFIFSFESYKNNIEALIRFIVGLLNQNKKILYWSQWFYDFEDWCLHFRMDIYFLNFLENEDFEAMRNFDGWFTCVVFFLADCTFLWICCTSACQQQVYFLFILTALFNQFYTYDIFLWNLYTFLKSQKWIYIHVHTCIIVLKKFPKLI